MFNDFLSFLFNLLIFPLGVQVFQNNFSSGETESIGLALNKILEQEEKYVSS